jgi:hypothetical protein
MRRAPASSARFDRGQNSTAVGRTSAVFDRLEQSRLLHVGSPRALRAPLSCFARASMRSRCRLFEAWAQCSSIAAVSTSWAQVPALFRIHVVDMDRDVVARSPLPSKKSQTQRPRPWTSSTSRTLPWCRKQLPTDSKEESTWPTRFVQTQAPHRLARSLGRLGVFEMRQERSVEER